MVILKYAAVVALGYLLGCSNMAYYIARLRGVNLRAGGSGNLGASNSVTLMGWGAGLAVGLHDILKAMLAAILASKLFPELSYAAAAAGVAAVLGHIFPFWLKFHGGKGFASFVGMTIVLDWKFAVIVAIVIIVVSLITDYIVAGTVAAVVMVPAWECFYRHLPVAAAIVCIATAVILFKHRQNFVRIAKGTEIGIRSGGSGKYRQ